MLVYTSYIFFQDLSSQKVNSLYFSLSDSMIYCIVTGPY